MTAGKLKHLFIVHAIFNHRRDNAEKQHSRRATMPLPGNFEWDEEKRMKPGITQKYPQ